jgi:hypothetical protein
MLTRVWKPIWRTFGSRRPEQMKARHVSVFAREQEEEWALNDAEAVI